MLFLVIRSKFWILGWKWMPCKKNTFESVKNWVPNCFKPYVCTRFRRTPRLYPCQGCPNTTLHPCLLLKTCFQPAWAMFWSRHWHRVNFQPKPLHRRPRQWLRPMSLSQRLEDSNTWCQPFLANIFKSRWIPMGVKFNKWYK